MDTKGDNSHNSSGLQAKIREYKMRQKKGSYHRVDKNTLIFVENGKSVKEAIENFYKKHNIKRIQL